MLKRRAISHLLVLAALVAAWGTDHLAQAGGVVRADAMVDVAERMAARFRYSFDRKSHRPAVVRLDADRRWAMAGQAEVSELSEKVYCQTHLNPHVLYLPPPAMA